MHGQRRELNRRPADSNAHLTPFSQRLDCLAERRRQRVPATAAVAAPTATAAASTAASAAAAASSSATAGGAVARDELGAQLLVA